MNTVKNHLIIKKCIRLVAEKFSYSTDYINEIISISNSSSQINIEPIRENNYKISYEYLTQPKSIIISIDELFDTLIQYLKFDGKREIFHRKGEVITLENWVREEDISLKEIEETLFNLKEDDLELYKFRGNRIMAEYYKGLIILSDDLGYYKSEIIVS